METHFVASAAGCLVSMLSATPLLAAPVNECHRPADCHSLAVACRDGKERAIDLPRALLLFEQSCQAHFAPACAAAGLLYEEGRGVPAEPPRAGALF